MKTTQRSTIHVGTDPAMSAAARVELWQDVMRLIGEIEVPRPNEFSGQFTSKNLGEMRTAHVQSSTYSVSCDRGSGVPVAREHVFLNLVDQGVINGRVANRTVRMEPGTVVLSRSTSNLDLTLEDCTWLGVLIPRGVFDRHMHWQPRYDGMIYRGDSVLAVLLGGLVRSLCALPNALTTREASRATTAALALMTACLGAAPSTPRDASDKNGSNDGAKDGIAKAIRRFIVHNLPNPALDIASICKEFAISRSALYRIMSETGDVATVIRSLRLQAIATDLASGRYGDEPLAATARRWGYVDPRTFRRAFVREFGRPPSALRDGNDTAQLLGPVSTDLQRWFLGL